jgi:hypothetical protein
MHEDGCLGKRLIILKTHTFLLSCSGQVFKTAERAEDMILVFRETPSIE